MSRSVVALLNIPVEAESLHAALRLILRLTREHQHAVLFAELGGPKVLLGLTQASAFQGFVSLATLIFRHILEEPASLKYCMEKVKNSSVPNYVSCLLVIVRTLTQRAIREVLAYTAIVYRKRLTELCMFRFGPLLMALTISS